MATRQALADARMLREWRLAMRLIRSERKFSREDAVEHLHERLGYSISVRQYSRWENAKMKKGIPHWKREDILGVIEADSELILARKRAIRDEKARKDTFSTPAEGLS